MRTRFTFPALSVGPVGDCPWSHIIIVLLVNTTDGVVGDVSCVPRHTPLDLMALMSRLFDGNGFSARLFIYYPSTIAHMYDTIPIFDPQMIRLSRK